MIVAVGVQVRDDDVVSDVVGGKEGGCLMETEAEDIEMEIGCL